MEKCARLLVPYSESESDEDETTNVSVTQQEIKSDNVAPLLESQETSSLNGPRPVTDSYDTSSDSTSSYDSSSETESESSNDTDSDNEEVESNFTSSANKFPSDKTTKVGKPNCRTEGELGIDDLPAIEHLKISVNENELMHLGYVLSVVDRLVVVQSLPDTPALNMDTAIFTGHGKCVGQVFETFGPVRQPLYVLRFNNTDEINERELALNVPLYYAPRKQELTAFVFAEMLRRHKGCDASWKNDNEPPDDKLDYSDDEQERLSKQKKKNKSQQKPSAPTNVETSHALNTFVGQSNDVHNWPLKSPRPSARAMRRQRRGCRVGRLQPAVSLQQNPFSSFYRRWNQPPASVSPLPSLEHMSDFWRSVPPPQFQTRQDNPSVCNYWASLPPPPPPSFSAAQPQLKQETESDVASSSEVQMLNEGSSTFNYDLGFNNQEQTFEGLSADGKFKNFSAEVCPQVPVIKKDLVSGDIESHDFNLSVQPSTSVSDGN